MASILRARFDFKYGGADWRKDRAETFQKTKEVRTNYITADGQLVEKIETTKEYASVLARVGADPVVGPPYYYADKNFHADPYEIFQKTRIKTSTYEQFSETSYKIKIDDFDVLHNIHTYSTVEIDGKIPLTPTKKSALIAYSQEPIVGTLAHKCAWVDNTVPLDLPYAEDEEDIGKAARRQQQRDSAIARTITIPFNPFIKPGHTVRLVIPSRGIDADHMVIGTSTKHSSDTGSSMTQLSLEYWAHDA